MSILETLEDVKQRMCDGYCKYAHSPVPEGKSEDWLFEDDDSPCINCPLNEL